RVGPVVVTVQDLNLVGVHQEDTAVAPSLAFALDDGGRGPLDVQLDVAETRTAGDVARSRRDLEVTVLDLPFRRAIPPAPLREAGAVEQHNGIRRRPPRRLRRAGRTGVDDGRLRAVGVVDVVAGIRQDRGVAVSE